MFNYQSITSTDITRSCTYFSNVLTCHTICCVTWRLIVKKFRLPQKCIYFCSSCSWNLFKMPTITPCVTFHDKTLSQTFPPFSDSKCESNFHLHVISKKPTFLLQKLSNFFIYIYYSFYCIHVNIFFFNCIFFTEKFNM